MLFLLDYTKFFFPCSFELHQGNRVAFEYSVAWVLEKFVQMFFHDFVSLLESSKFYIGIAIIFFF